MNRRVVARLGLLVILGLGIVVAVLYRDQFSTGGLQAIMDRLGFWAPLGFVALYLLAPALLLPGGPITLAAGALFGPLLGTIYSLVGATGGATLAFILARYAAGDWVERKTEGKMARLKSGVENEGWRFVAFVRLVPLFPFNLLNYALGLTKIPLRTYVITSFICMLPGAAGYAYLGYAGREAILGAENWVAKGLIAVGVLAVLILLPIMIRHWRRNRMLAPRNLSEWLQAGTDVLVLDVRTSEEYRGPLGHIESSTLIPIDDLENRVGELEPFKERPVVVV